MGEKKKVLKNSDKTSTNEKPTVEPEQKKQADTTGQDIVEIEAIIAKISPKVFCVKTTLFVPKRVLRIIADTDEGISIDECSKLNRTLRNELSLSENYLLKKIGEDYEIEVFSPGVGSPLLLKRQYNKNIGRTLQVLLQTGISIEGELRNVSEDIITIKISQKNPETNKKEWVDKNISFSEIKESKVMVTFNTLKKS